MYESTVYMHSFIFGVKLTLALIHETLAQVIELVKSQAMASDALGSNLSSTTARCVTLHKSLDLS